MRSIVTGPAWQARDHQRQIFVDSMMRKIRDEQDRQDDNDLFQEELLMAFVMLLTQRRQATVLDSWNQVIQNQAITMKRLVSEILSDAIYFGKVAEETHLVLGILMEKVAGSIQTEIVAAMNKKQIFSTKEVLGVESATEKVDYLIEE